MASKPRELIIHDTTPNDILYPRGKKTGLDLSGRPEGLAYGGTATPFPDELLIPRSEWQARIQEMEARKTRLSDLCTAAGLPCKDQGQTNYCWINAPTYCMEVMRVAQHQTMELLSPASAGAQITGYRNQGGWGKAGLEYISNKGLVPVSRWPANAIDRRYATDENLKLALNYRCTEWFEIEPGNLDQFISALFRRMPVAIGLSWWSHEVSAIDPVWIDGAIGTRDRNSWGMSYGTEGYFILQGRRMMPDDAATPVVAIAYNASPALAA